MIKSNQDILMLALINCNNNYRNKKPTVLQKIKNVTPPEKKFVQVEFDLENDIEQEMGDQR